MEKIQKMKPKRIPKIQNRIHYCRMIAGLKQKDISFLMKKPESQISRWERGSRVPNVYHAIGLAIATNRLVDDLFSDYRREWKEKIRKKIKLLKKEMNK
ncbi:MAG: helix-turn-helix transcriptional regulator [Candidatus Pacebacteria bacterium]|nr:helix-turn-helix transcriptional regulator [Candidatus Paceibacterota bacterium]